MHQASSNNKMLEFLKKIFQSEEQEAKKITEISLQNLEEWLNQKSKPLMEEVQQQTEGILMRINEVTNALARASSPTITNNPTANSTKGSA